MCDVDDHDPVYIISKITIEIMLFEYNIDTPRVTMSEMNLY